MYNVLYDDVHSRVLSAETIKMMMMMMMLLLYIPLSLTLG